MILRVHGILNDVLGGIHRGATNHGVSREGGADACKGHKRRRRQQLDLSHDCTTFLGVVTGVGLSSAGCKDVDRRVATKQISELNQSLGRGVMEEGVVFQRGLRADDIVLFL